MNATVEIAKQINDVDDPPSSVQDGSSQNGSGTYLKSDTPLTPPCSADVRRQLIALRVKHGPDTAIGHRASNLVELLRLPELPAAQISRQMAELKRLLAAQ